MVLSDFASTTAHDGEDTTTAVAWNADDGWLSVSVRACS
jgi:hypothetical protein